MLATELRAMGVVQLKGSSRQPQTRHAQGRPCRVLDP